MKHIIFVCHGNTCRSPMAEFITLYLLKKENLSQQIKVSSAGLLNQSKPISEQTVKQLQKHNIPFKQRRSKQIFNTTVKSNTLLIALDHNVYNQLVKHYSTNKLIKITTLSSFVQQYTEQSSCVERSSFTETSSFTEHVEQGSFTDIQNPMKTHNYNRCFQQIYQCCEQLVLSLKKESE